MNNDKCKKIKSLLIEHNLLKTYSIITPITFIKNSVVGDHEININCRVCNDSYIERTPYLNKNVKNISYARNIESCDTDFGHVSEFLTFVIQYSLFDKRFRFKCSHGSLRYDFNSKHINRHILLLTDNKSLFLKYRLKL